MNKKKIIIFLAIFLFFIIYLFVSENIYHNSIINFYNFAIEKCENNIILNEDYCNNIKNFDYSSSYYNNFFAVFLNIAVDNLNILNIIYSLLLIIPSLLWIYKTIKHKTFINNYLRESNNKFILRIFKESYIYPLAVILAFIVFFIYLAFNTNFVISEELLNNLPWNLYSIQHPLIFIIVYLLNILLCSYVYLNIGLLVLTKGCNYVVFVIASILSIFSNQLFLEIFVRKIIYNIFKFEWLGLFDIINVFMIDDKFGIFNSILFILIVFIITTMLVIKKFKNKEKFLIKCEEN